MLEAARAGYRMPYRILRASPGQHPRAALVAVRILRELDRELGM